MRFFKEFFSNEKICNRILVLWLSILSALYSLLSVLRHMHFQSGGFDLGIFDQTVWQYAHFLTPFNTIKGKLILGDHLTLTMPLLAPLYWAWSDVRILLIFQAVFITLSSVAVYKIARIRNFSPFVSLSLSFIYSIFWGIQFAVYFDFHPIVIGVALLIWLVYFFESKKWKIFWLTLTLMLLTQENMGIALACVGFIYFFQKKYRKQSFLFILGGAMIALMSTRIIALMSPTGYEYSPTFDLNPIHLFLKYFDSPDKKLVWFYSLSWFSFIPFLSPGTILAMLGDLSQYFLPKTQFGHMVTPFLHERAILAPLITLGLFDVLAFLQKRKINVTIIVILLVLSALLQQFVFHFPLNKLSKPSYWKEESWMKDDENLFKEIPKNASIATAQNLAPHLSQRKEIYLIYPRVKNIIGACSNCWWLESAGKPQYMVVDLHPNQWLTQLLESNENFQSAVKNMEKARKIIKVKNINSAFLYKINY